MIKPLLFGFSSLVLIGACAGDGSDGPSKDDIRAQGKTDDGHDWCGELGWYGDHICDDFCTKRDPDCATDSREPELADPADVLKSKIRMAEGLAQAAQQGPIIEAKYEPANDGKLALSTYPVPSLTLDSERNTFSELAGGVETAPWNATMETFHDFEHLVRSSRDLTLRQLSAYGIEELVGEIEEDGARVYWAIPTIQEGRSGYGVWALYGGHGVYGFFDGSGSNKRQTLDLGVGPGAGATDARTPELGNDITVMRQSKIKMSTALKQVLKSYPLVIEAKFELDGDNKLSLSIYPTSQGKRVDPEHQEFFELAGDPTVLPFAPSATKFDVPDEEHVTRSARDLTLVQTQTMSLLDAVQKAEAQISGGIVFWAIPTMRGTRSGYGVYVLAPNNTVHYLFLS
ncbi:MAG TPA: hypothetical protein VIV40_38095 [Kofleriaceae bacterium]